MFFIFLSFLFFGALAISAVYGFGWMYISFAWLFRIMFWFFLIGLIVALVMSIFRRGSRQPPKQV